MAYQKLLYTISGKAVPDNFSAQHKITSGFFNREITQLNQYLLGNGMTLTNERNKELLGDDFDVRLQQQGRTALVQGVSFGYLDTVSRDTSSPRAFKLYTFGLTEFVPLYDEENGALMAGVRFWQIDRNRPLRATLYEPDGLTEYIQRKNQALEILAPKRAYRQIQVSSKVDGTEIFDGEGFPGLPIVPLWGNPQHQSELVGLREAIDCLDLIKSGFANDLDDASMIYWTLQNAGGMDDVDLATFVQRMKTVKAAAVDDNAKAEAHTLEVPYQSRVAYLERLEHDLYRDAQVMNVDTLSAAQKTTQEIDAAYQPMDNKTDQFEYCVLDFLKQIFALAGIDDTPTFKRSKIVNQMEETQMVLMAAQYLDEETLLNKIPWLTPEEVQDILERRDEEEQKRLADVEDNLDNLADQEQQTNQDEEVENGAVV